MSLFDQVMKQAGAIFGSRAGAAPAAEGGGEEPSAESTNLLGGVVEMLQKEGVGSLLQRFKDKGFGDIVGSWVGTGANLPISLDQLKQGLGPELIEKLAARTGLSHEQVSAALAHVLPNVVDRVTPNGVLEDEAATVEVETVEVATQSSEG